MVFPFSGNHYTKMYWGTEETLIPVYTTVAEAVANLKKQDGQAILVAGSSQLVHTLRQHDLVDEYRLMLHPVVLGGGLPLFHDGLGATRLKLLGTHSLPKGIVVLSYAPERDQAP